MSKDIFIHSAASLNQKKAYTCPCRRASRPYKYHLYPIKLISALNAVLQTRKYNDMLLIQYVVSPQNELLLAQEGIPSTFIPTHKEMKLKTTSATVSVFAAGYLFLNSAGEIIGISNESDDFKEQDLLSLLRPVSILHILKAPVAKNFSVIPSTLETHQFELTAENRQEIVEKLPLNCIEAMLTANQKTKIITREPTSSAQIMQGVRREVLFTMPELMAESTMIKQHDELHFKLESNARTSAIKD